MFTSREVRALVESADRMAAALAQAVEFFERNGGDPNYTFLPEMRAALGEFHLVAGEKEITPCK